MPIIVQKFGGTSVASADARRHVSTRVAEVRSEGFHPVVVVSAMGRAGDPYATDTLLDLIRAEGGAAQPREVDGLIACGERIAGAVLAQSLSACGVRAVSLSGEQAGIMTDDAFGNARIVEIRTSCVTSWIDRGYVPVVAGFQGVTKDGDVTTLGRGGSDTTAVALGAALHAVRVEIYTDVDGVKTADPKLVPTAATLTHVGYREVAELAHLGAKVIHPRAVEIAMQGSLPLYVKRLRGTGGGTRIDGVAGATVEAPAADRPVRGIAHIPRRAWTRISIDDRAGAVEETSLAVFESIAAQGVSVDMIHVTPGRISFIIPEQARDVASAALAPLPVAADITVGMAKVSAVGAGMHGSPGVMARMLGALVRANVTVLDTSDSHANISCLVAEQDVPRATEALHDEFRLSDGR